MKSLALVTLAAASMILAGCATELYDPGSGRKVASFRSDITDGNYVAGATSFKFAKMSNSVPTRAALLGANKIVGTVASAGVAIALPGSGAAPTLGKAAISAVPHLSAPVAKPGD